MLADALEAHAWKMLLGFGPDPTEVQELLVRALRIREEAQGKEHPDIIWTLSLLIEALGWEGSLTAAREAAELGERRLLLRRKVFADVPEEIALAVTELVELYHFEDEPFDKRRIAQLRRRK